MHRKVQGIIHRVCSDLLRTFSDFSTLVFCYRPKCQNSTTANTNWVLSGTPNELEYMSETINSKQTEKVQKTWPLQLPYPQTLRSEYSYHILSSYEFHSMMGQIKQGFACFVTMSFFLSDRRNDLSVPSLWLQIKLYLSSSHLKKPHTVSQ